MYYSTVVLSLVTILSCTASIYSKLCGIPIYCLLSNNSGSHVARCDVPDSQSTPEKIESKLSFPSHSRLKFIFSTELWLTEISICNGRTSNISTFSLAASTYTDSQLSPIQFASLYNSSLTAGGLIHLEKGESQRIKFQNPIQPDTFVIFGYGLFGAEGSIRAQLFGHHLSNLSYPFTTSNLLQYSFPEPNDQNCTSSTDQVEKGIVYGNDGLLVDGVISNSCLTWNASSYSSHLPLTFSFYRATSIQTIIINHLVTTMPITNVMVYSPGTVPMINSMFSNTTATINFTTPLFTDYLQVAIEFENELTLTEIEMHNSEGDNVFNSLVLIHPPMATRSYLVALISTASCLSFLLLSSLFAILILLIILCRSQRNLSILIRFYDTLTPESLAVYSTIRRTPKSRDYVNMIRFFNEKVATQEIIPKSSQPLPSRPGTRLKCMSESSSIVLGDYEKVGPALEKHESIKNSSSDRSMLQPGAKIGLTHALSNNLTFFNRSRCGIRTSTNIDQEENIIYDSPPRSPDPPGPHPYSRTQNSTHTASYLDPSEVTEEDFKSSDPIPLSVSNHHLYKLARSPSSPSQPHATFHFEDSESTSRGNARHLAGITLSQLNDSVSSDSV